MSPTKYRTIEDIRGIVSTGIPEGLTLEYKSSDIVLTTPGSSAICKGVTAFANSVGGQFIVGVATKNFKPVSLDAGVNNNKARDWIYQVVNANTSPPVESFEVFEILGASGSYYVIDVPRSEYAPHQFDGRYYKRRGPHSEPMEHYEVDDVRNRPKKASTPLRLDVVVRQDIMLLLYVRNDHDSQSLTNLRFQFEANFDLDNLSARDTLTKRGLRSLRPRSELFFNLDTALNILQKSEEAELTVRADYEFMGNHVLDSFVFHLGDYKMSAVVTSDELNLMKKLIDKVGDLVKELDHLRRDGEPLRKMVDGTGLRISHRTLSSLRGEGPKFKPTEFDALGYQLIMDVSHSDASRLQRLFHSWGSDKKKEYDELPKELREKFEATFKVEF